MPLEHTIICIDNSEWMRNGDYIPNRLECQHDAANLIVNAKTQQNQESTVGFLTMANKSGIELLVSPTDDMAKLLSCLHGVKIGGQIDIISAIKVSELALKHKRATRGASRIVLFIGSPLQNVDERQLAQIGKKMKKNNVAVDIVSFGEVDENESKLNALIEAVNNENNSHMVSIPPGLSPSDVIISSPIIYGDTGGQGDIGGNTSSNGGGGGGDFGGFGGDMDFEQQLQMAMRQSYEEERARVERERKEKEGNEGGGGEQMDGIPEEGGFDDLDEEEMMRKAMELSMEEENNNNTQENTTSSAPTTSDAMDIEGTGGQRNTDAPQNEDIAPEFLDEEFVQSMLADFQVDPNHPAILDALASVRGDGTNNESKDESEKKDKEEEKK